MPFMDWAKLVGGGVAAPFTGGATLPIALSGLSGVVSGAAKGSADERGNQNVYTTNQDKTRSANYGTQQGALLNSLLAAGRDKMSGYETKQGATSAATAGAQGAWNTALGNESAEKIALAKLGMEAPLAGAKASILGSLMKNMQPHSFTAPSGQAGHLTSVKGGMSAANLDPLTRQQGEAMLQQALQNQLSGGNLPKATNFREGIQDWKGSILDAPEATDYSKGLMAPPELSDYKKAGKGESILSGLGLGLGLAGSVAGAMSGGGNEGGGGPSGFTPGWEGNTSILNPTRGGVFDQLADDYVPD